MSKVTVRELGPAVHHVVRVPAARAGSRLDVAAVALLPDYSRERIKQWILAGELTVDGLAARPSDRVSGGEQLSLNGSLPRVADWQVPQAVPFAVRFADDDLIVVDKPSGVVTHPGAGNADGTLVNGLLASFPALQHVPRAGVVHRLDKETSGLLIVARTVVAHAALVKVLAARGVERSYVTVVRGTTRAQQVDAPIGRDPRRRTRMAVRRDGKPARTFIEPLAASAEYSVLRAQLETGRTHQIRVHLQHLGLPIVGDRTYGARSPLPEVMDRVALHAYRLRLQHPRSGQLLEVKSMLPADMSELVAQLRIAWHPDDL